MDYAKTDMDCFQRIMCKLHKNNSVDEVLDEIGILHMQTTKQSKIIVEYFTFTDSRRRICQTFRQNLY